MVFFVSKENKHLTTLTGIRGFLGRPSGLAAPSCFTSLPMVIPNCAFPGWRSHCFLECRCPAFLCSGHLDSSLVLLSLSPSPLAKRFLHLNYWFEDFFGSGWPRLRRRANRRAELSVFAGRSRGRLHIRQSPTKSFCVRTHSPIPRTCISPSKSLSPRCSATSFIRRSIGRGSTPR